MADILADFPSKSHFRAAPNPDPNLRTVQLLWERKEKDRLKLQKPNLNSFNYSPALCLEKNIRNFAGYSVKNEND
ncbi:hypothetical protein [Flavilitoribacter nigricans]|uniref:Uncharacterized protein n=1 Tax=Flavilitoribacter nigricans (strain ATCC 23147 / DSM 23189 / NBRC 102662 / NCIMB 1420 / SS-2) TaxID=1122177 RepID=A0A2D0NFJ0_FLAN2|nr:hypothetical protein [Flavilitoribacter nigricans]PHN07264.1 hypothetical protein CRP01_06440 [Flavilitoribacter nigricans DSM 23189 = NBRC 102662]